jgi:dTDP-glucose pyrophosphorylase
MKGVVLAGGLGTRMHPLTKVTNKHLLPVYNEPMIYYPIKTLVNAGIDEILIVTGGNNAGDFLRLMGNGKDFGLKHINYTYQEGEGGIAAALAWPSSLLIRTRSSSCWATILLRRTFAAPLRHSGIRKMEPVSF